ncbi:hypothetical protein HDU76_002853 [Blyttiomyces sp. JEL0837]|nr:hypothetical protein HDU76_002853 [Blyttiomyces sp. JEL0837]
MLDPTKLTIPKINNKNKETWIFDNKPLLRAVLNAKANETYEHDLYQHLVKDMEPKKENYTKKDDKGVEVEDEKEYKKAFVAWKRHEHLASAYIFQLLEDRQLQHLFMGTSVSDKQDQPLSVYEGQPVNAIAKRLRPTIAQRPGETLLIYHRRMTALMLALKTAGYLGEEKYKLMREEYYGKECYEKFVMGSEDPFGIEEIFDCRGYKNDMAKVGVYLEEQHCLLVQSRLQCQHITDLALSAASKSSQPQRKTYAGAASASTGISAGQQQRNVTPKPNGPRKEPEVPKTPVVFVGNLDYGINTADMLKDIFKGHGNIVAAVIGRKRDAEDGKWKHAGYGLVQFATLAEAVTAHKDFNGKRVLSRDILVTAADHTALSFPQKEKAHYVAEEVTEAMCFKLFTTDKTTKTMETFEVIVDSGCTKSMTAQGHLDNLRPCTPVHYQCANGAKLSGSGIILRHELIRDKTPTRVQDLDGGDCGLQYDVKRNFVDRNISLQDLRFHFFTRYAGRVKQGKLTTPAELLTFPESMPSQDPAAISTILAAFNLAPRNDPNSQLAQQMRDPLADMERGEVLFEDLFPERFNKLIMMMTISMMSITISMMVFSLVITGSKAVSRNKLPFNHFEYIYGFVKANSIPNFKQKLRHSNLAIAKATDNLRDSFYQAQDRIQDHSILAAAGIGRLEVIKVNMKFDFLQTCLNVTHQKVKEARLQADGL